MQEYKLSREKRIWIIIIWWTTLIIHEWASKSESTQRAYRKLASLFFRRQWINFCWNENVVYIYLEYEWRRLLSLLSAALRSLSSSLKLFSFFISQSEIFAENGNKLLLLERVTVNLQIGQSRLREKSSKALAHFLSPSKPVSIHHISTVEPTHRWQRGIHSPFLFWRFPNDALSAHFLPFLLTRPPQNR